MRKSPYNNKRKCINEVDAYGEYKYKIASDNSPYVLGKGERSYDDHPKGLTWSEYKRILRIYHETVMDYLIGGGTWTMPSGGGKLVVTTGIAKYRKSNRNLRRFVVWFWDKTTCRWAYYKHWRFRVKQKIKESVLDNMYEDVSFYTRYKRYEDLRHANKKQ